ncbi:twin-arginine translocation signal domain-containing protein [Haloarchaeobius amylolyticus]|uniref:twin-arginine translocation signal domain-containing protein n=1 Tax=Haloarchaeobius amylolyticus TaxID=1198296 RepID=UPI002270516F|nr:twin-arginine translocation signal domain-containing protein [Haloarchaeobius amylolyticus]
MNRRTFLAGTGTAVGTLLSGCSALSSQEKNLGLVVLNRDETSHRVGIKLLRPNADDYNEARVYSGQVNLPAGSSGEPTEVTRDGVAERHPYIVQIDLYDVERRIAPYHFYPGCDGPDESLVIEVDSADDGRVYFQFLVDC